MSYVLRKYRQGDCLHFPIEPQFESGDASELDEIFSRAGNFALSIIQEGKVVGVVHQRRIKGAIATITAFDERPSKEIAVLVRTLLEGLQYASGLPAFTLSKKNEKVERWHEFLGFVKDGDQDGFERYVFQPEEHDNE